jgi:hypothetical protein
MPHGTSSAYLWKTCRPAIPKASPRALPVAARSALGHPLYVAAAGILVEPDLVTDRDERVTGPGWVCAQARSKRTPDSSHPQAGEPLHRPRRAVLR